MMSSGIEWAIRKLILLFSNFFPSLCRVTFNVMQLVVMKLPTAVLVVARGQLQVIIIGFLVSFSLFLILITRSLLI